MFKIYNFILSFYVIVFSGSCGALNPTGSMQYEASRLPIGPLTIGTWLPAGMNEFRFTESDQEL